MLENFSKDKILTYYHEAKTISEGKMPSPRMVTFYPTYRCNLSCHFCLYKDILENKDFPEDRLMPLLSELKRCEVKSIELSGGEPTIYKHFNKLIIEAGSMFKVGVLTNGTTLNKNYKLLSDNCSYTRISIESCKLKDVKRFVEYRNKTGSKCVIGLKALIGKSNWVNIKEKVRFAEDCGVDYIQFKATRDCPDELSGESKQMVDRVIQTYKMSNQIIIGGVLDAKPYHKCFMSPIHTVIDPHGDMYLCCFYHYRKKSHKIGNVLKRDFCTEWFSNKHNETIKNVNIKECMKYDCRFHEYNRTMDEVLNGGSLIDFI